MFLKMAYCLPLFQICDVISRWEAAYLEQFSGIGVKADPSRSVRLSLRCHVYHPSRTRFETDKER